MNNIAKNIITIACAFAITGSAVAQTPVDLIDDDFSASATATGGRFAVDDIDTGNWLQRSDATWAISAALTNPGVNINGSIDVDQGAHILNTVSSADTLLTGITVSFDYTVGAGTTLYLHSHLFSGANTLTGTANMARMTNTIGRTFAEDFVPDFPSGFNLKNGAAITGDAGAAITSIVGDGVAGSYSESFYIGNFSGISSIADVSGVLAIFALDSAAAGDGAVSITNFKITAVVGTPPPATPGTWDGETDANWNTNTNWETDLLPISTDVLTFTGTANTATNNDIVAGSEFAGISFTNTLDTQSFTLAGNSIILGGDISQSAAISGSIIDTISLNMELNGDRTVDSGTDHNLEISGIISEDGSARSLIKDGAGTLTLSAANTYTGGTSIEGGSVQLNNVNGFGTGTIGLADTSATLVLSDGISFGTAFTVSDTGDEKVLQLENGTTNTGTYSGAITVNEVTDGNFQLDAGGTDSGNANTNDDLYTQILDITGDITSTAGAGLRITGDGVVRLGGNNDITGTINISNRGSKLRVGHNNALGTAAVRINNRKAELQLEDGITIANNLTFTGNSNVSKQITVDDGNALVAESATATGTILLEETSALAVEFVAQEFDTLTLSGVISGGAGNDWQKLGAGTVILTAANDYTGLTTITEGTLQLGDGTSGNDGVIVGDIVNDSDLTFNTFGAGSYAGGITGTGSVTKIGAGTQTISGALQLGTAQQQFNVTSNGDAAPELSISGGIGADGENDLIKNGTGTLLLTGDNSAGAVVIAGVGDADFDGINRVRIKEGVVQVEQANNLGDNSIFISDLGTVGILEFVGSSATTIENEIALRGSAGTNTILRASGTTMAAAVEYSYGNLGQNGDTLTLDGANTGSNTIGFDLNTNGNLLAGGLTKDGVGTWVLKAGVAQTYTGDTTVAGGTLVLNEADLDDASTVTIATGAVLQLDHSDTDLVAALTLGGVAQLDGTYDSSTPGGFITGTGSIEVSSASPYDTWAAGFPSLTDSSMSLDFDFGGLETGIEYVVGGDPTDASDDLSLAPTSSYTGSALEFDYRRSDLANGDSNTVITVEYGSDLSGWDPAVDLTDGVTITVTDDFYGAGIDRVVVSLPDSLAVDGKLFARLSVVTAP